MRATCILHSADGSKTAIQMDTDARGVPPPVINCPVLRPLVDIIAEGPISLDAPFLTIHFRRVLVIDELWHYQQEDSRARTTPPTADCKAPDFAKPIAPLADWMKRAGDLIDEATPK